MWVNQLQQALMTATVRCHDKPWVGKMLRVADKQRPKADPKPHANLSFHTARKLKQEGVIPA